MKGIKIPINFASFRDLVLQARDYLTRSLVTVNSLPGSGKRKPLDRSKVRPWHMLPSIQGFRIKLSPMDGLLTLFALKKRFPNRMEFDCGKNDNANKYIDYMFDRIRIQVTEKKFKAAGNTVGILMESPAYQAAALNHVLHNGHRNIPVKHVKRIMRNVKDLARKRATSIEYSRVYLHETHKIRPLGVPSMAGRIYLHMLNNCLVEGRLVTEGNQQHGYLPKRGVITAGREICRRLNSPNIYEADFKQFFPSVSLPAIRVSLLKTGFPLAAALFIEEINSSQPKLPKVQLLDESGIKAEAAFHKERRKVGSDPKLSALMYTFNEHKDGAKTIPAGLFKGVPQGAPTSCSLATGVLRSLYHLDVILYADDIIYFPKSSSCDPITDLEIPKGGIRVHRDKSKWLKKDGVGLVDSFKFLGIRYYPARKLVYNSISIAGLVLQYLAPSRLGSKPRFVAETRKGANLEFTDRESFLSYLAIARELLLDSKYLRGKMKTYTLARGILTREASGTLLGNKAKLLFGEVVRLGNDIMSREYFDSLHPIIKRGKGKDGIKHYLNPLTGYFLSRMQSNSGNLSVKQDFTLTHIPESGVGKEGAAYSGKHIVPSSRINIFTASSFAINDMMEYLSNSSNRKRKPKSIIRRVVTNTPRTFWYEEAVKTRALLLSAKAYDFPGETLAEPKYESPGGALLPILGVDLVLGIPLFSVSFMLTWLTYRRVYTPASLGFSRHY